MSSTDHRIFSCERCSRRKQRCDKALPRCTPCRDSGSICKESDKEAGAVQLADNAIARKGYVTTLLERLDALEKEARLRGLPVEVPESGLATGPMDLNDQPRSSPRRYSHQSNESGTRRTNKSRVDMDTLSLSAMAEPRSRAEEFLKQLSMPRIIAGVTETYGGNPEATSRIDSLWDGISQYIRHPIGQSRRIFVRQNEALKSLKTYLEVVDFRFPRLPVAKVQSGINAICAQDDAQYTKTLSSDPAHIFMAYMVIAIVPLVSDDYPISQGSFVSIHVLAKCLEVLDRVFNQEDGVDIIQCLHLLVVFSIHCSAAGSAWHLIGFAMNKCIALGYHRDDDRIMVDGLDEDLQQRRWAFWGCYFLDRLICAALARPFSIENRDISISLPDVALESPIEAYHVHLFRYSILLSSLIGEVSSQTFHDRLGHLLHWRACTPPGNHPSTERALLYQNSLFHTLMLRVAIRHILTAYEPRDSSHDSRSFSYVGSGSSELTSPRDARILEWHRVQDLSLLEICRAVAGSLDRVGMVGRNFLSLITGYSAFSMALAALYAQCTTSAGFRSQNMPPSTEDLPYQGSDGSGSDREWASTCREVWRAQVRVACEKLAIVSRQFLRMQEYKCMAERFQKFIDTKETSGQVAIDQQELRTLELEVMSIGPNHLMCLTRAILFLLGD